MPEDIGQDIIQDIFIDEYRPEDAARAAAMWQASQSVWYGGDITSTRLTEDKVIRDMRNTRRLATFVARAGEQLVGWCDLTHDWKDPKQAYVLSLSADPRVHKRGVGRRLLRAAFDRAMALGFRRLNLDTWAGNRRAMPLYKKMGFFWVPGTSVIMHNFLPTVLRSPLVVEFLRGIDWYSALRQPTEMVEDDQKLDDRPVYTYRFERDGGLLRIVVDRASGEILAVEGSHFAVALVAPPRLVIGASGLAQCRLSTDGQSSVGPGALWTEGALSPARRVLREQKGSTEAGLELTLEAQAKGNGLLRAELLVQGQPLHLGAAVEVLAPLEITPHAHYWPVALGRPARFSLDVRNHSAAPEAVSLRALHEAGLEVSIEGAPVEVKPGHKRTLAVQVQARRPGVHILRLEPLAAETTSPAGGPQVPVAAPGFGEVVAYWCGDEAVLESEHVRVTMEKASGAISVYDGRGEQKLAAVQLRIGPPFLPPEAWRTGDELALLSERAAGSIRHSMPLPEPAGLRLEQKVSLEAGGRLRLEATLHNASAAPISPTARWGIRDFGAQRVAVPLKTGLVHAPTVGFPTWRDGQVAPEDFAENWLAREHRTRALGLHWERFDALSLWDDHHGTSLSLRCGEISPGGRHTLEPVELWVGVGDWRSARGQWYSSPADGLRVVGSLRLEARPAVVFAGDAASVELVVASEVLRPSTVRVGASASPGLRIDQTQVELAEVARQRPDRFSLAVSSDRNGAGVGAITLHASSCWTAATHYVPVIRLAGERTACMVQEANEQGQPLVNIDNGWATLRVAPGFAGAVVAWEREGINHLHTSFPTPDVFTWFGPWYGGISPAIGLPEHEHVPGQVGLLAQDSLRWEALPQVRRGERIWSGARLWGPCSAVPWLRLAVEYLTLPGSNLLLAILRLANVGPGAEVIRAGFNAFVKPNGARTDAAVYWSPWDPPYVVPDHHTFDKRGGPWAAVEANGAGIAAVSLSPETSVDAFAMGETGADLYVLAKPELEAGGETEVSALFALVKDGDEARCLSLLAGQPLGD